MPQRLRKVLEASRTNALPDDERIKYFRAMISEEEKEDIATANYQDGLEDGREQGREQQALEVARRMLEEQFPMETIIRISGLTEEQVRSIR